MNRLTSLTSPQGASSLSYDALSRRTVLTMPNGSRASYAYDAASQLTRLLNQGPGATPVTLADFAYTYDAGGNRATRSTPQGIASYDYDALNRLTQASQPDPIDPLRQVTEAFTYDPVGNRTASHLATGQVHDAANRLLEDSQFTFTYDATGNLTSKTAKATGARTVYTYSVENQLTQVDQFTVAGGSSPVLTATYRYDPLGRRIAKEVTQAGTPTTTRYVYDNEDILLELDGANALQARYTHGPGIDEPLIMLRGTQAFFYHADGLGSIWDLTDSAGAVAKSYTYDSFGNILAQPGTLANPYTYTGREVDAETGLYYYRARYYEPTIGRFVQKDLFIDLIMRSMPNPAQALSLNTQVLNTYLYVEGRPLSHLDPLGLWGFGIQPGAQAEGGTGIIGAGGQGGIGGGFFASGFFNRPSLGAFLQGGAFAGTPFGGFGWPGEKGGALGASVGGGVSAFLTNAVCVEQLAGPFTTTSVNVGLGPFKFSAQYATDGKTWVLSFGPPFAGVTYGISASIYQTSTTILGSTRR